MKKRGGNVRKFWLILAVFLFAAPCFAQTASGTISTSGTDCSTATNCVSLLLSSNASTGAISISGSFTGTLQFEVSADNANFAAVNAFPPNSTTAVTNATAAGTWRVSVAAMVIVRVRASALSSGTPSITIAASPATSTSLFSSGGGGGGSGTVTSFSSGNLSPLFTTSVGTPTTTPSLAFTLTNAAANTVLGNPTGSSAAPVYTANPTATSFGSIGNGGFSLAEGTGASLTAGVGTDLLFGDSTNHCLHQNLNNVDIGCIVNSATSPVVISAGAVSCPTCSANPMTTLGDSIGGGSAGAATRIAGPTTDGSTPYFWTSTPNASNVAQLESWAPAGVPVDSKSSATPSILGAGAATDRASLVLTTNNTTSTATSIAAAGSAGFDANFPFVICNTGTVVNTITPTTSTVNGNATQVLVGQPAGGNPECAFWWSNNVNFSSGEILPTDANGRLAAAAFPALTGNVTTSAGSLSTTIANNAVTNAMLAQMAAHTYKGNNTGSTANALDLTQAQLTAELNQFTSSLQGVVPSSGGGTTNFLRADGTWNAPAGGGGGSGGLITEAVNAVVVATSTHFVPLGGGGSDDTTETNVQSKISASAAISNLHVVLSAAPGVGNTLAFTLRDGATSGGQSDTALTCSISGASATTCDDTTHSVTPSAADFLDWKIVPTGTLTITPDIQIVAQFGTPTTAACSAVTSAVCNNAANTGTSAMTLDMSASTGSNAFKVPVQAGFTSGADGSEGYDSTNKNQHVRTNGADSIVCAFASAPTTGDLVKVTVSSGNTLCADSNAPAQWAMGGSITTAATPTGTEFMTIGGAVALSATEGNTQQIFPRAATINGLQVRVSAAEGAAATLAATLRKCTPSGSPLGSTCTVSDQTVTCTIPNSGFICSDTAHSFTVAQGDLIDLKLVQSGTGSAQIIFASITYF